MMEVNLYQTRGYYASETPCDCAYCKNYCKQIKSACNELSESLASYGIDIEKPFELVFVDSDDFIEYVDCQYLVLGECPDDFGITVGGITVTKNTTCHPSVSQYPRPNFVLSFSVTLPD